MIFHILICSTDILLNGFASLVELSSCHYILNFYLTSGPLKAEDEMKILVQGIIRRTHLGEKTYREVKAA